MTTEQMIMAGLCGVGALGILATFLPSPKPTRKKKFEADHEELQGIEEAVVLLANKCADRSSEYYRRYQLEADEEDLMLSRSMHQMVNDLKKLEDKVKPGSVIDNTLVKRVKDEPGWLGSLIGKKGRESSGSSQTEMADPGVYSGAEWARQKEEEMAL